MSQNKAIKAILNSIYHPRFQCQLDADTVLKDCIISDDNIVTLIFFEPAGSSFINETAPTIESKIFELDWVKELEIQLSIVSNNPFSYNDGLANVKQIIAVSSCKGGVGKSTIALNLAAALSLNGAQVGLFDADIHGPSLPTLITPKEMADTQSDEYIPPFINQNIKLMSYGYIQKQSNQPAILRGPIASNLLKQLLFKTDWGYLDYLIIDCPPGTGDIMLSLTQEIRLSGAVIVTSPHELSYVDVEKGIEMFNKVSVPNIAMIENMSYFKCSNCDEKHYIFGSGRIHPMVQRHQLPNWYEIPINQGLSSYSGKELPFLHNTNDEIMIELFKKIANDIVWHLITINQKSDIKIDFDNDKQTISVSNAGNSATHTYKNLRLLCTCAYCVDEITGEVLIKESDIDPNIEIERIFPVGHYAYGIDWKEHNKKHNSIYKIELLTNLE